MGNYYSKQQRKRVRDTDASSPTISKRPRPDVPSASGANSDPPASSTSVNGNNYYVFLSFRGPDTRKGFVDHLYQRLKDAGLPFLPNFVFRDNEDLAFGEKIGENLISAIECSKVSIPVISENYAASKWCLRELIHIMKCKESRGQIVLPVLYKVKTEDVKHMQGKFGEAFESSMGRFDEEVKQQGPLALREAVDLRVFESENFADGREGELVNELVEKILLEQRQDFQPHLPEKLVAIEDRVAEVMELVDLACPATRIIGIWGMGGIGKTTLATMIYNKLFNNFRYRSSLKDIRETAKSKGMEHVQSLLISDIRKVAKSTVRDPEMGIDTIRSSCEKKKVLILLDDVDHQHHLDELIGRCNFGSGSRIIITCRDKAVLDKAVLDKAVLESKYKMYALKELNREESMLLFSKYAFEGEQPPTDLAVLSSNIVATTGELPLALIVIGSLLKEKDLIEWEETLVKLRNAPNETVQEKLRISYDTLTYKEQQMFLDIACFFIGTDKTIATYFWADLEFFPITGLRILINRLLIKIDDNNQFRMHDQLRNLGRVIACPADKKPWDCSRLWDKEKVMKVLRREVENENIEALRLDQRGSKEFMRRESFKKMPNLKFLHVKDVDFDGDFEESLTELRWLEWEGCRDSLEMTNFHLEKLVVLDLSDDYKGGSCISENWRGWSSIKMERLKVLNLSWCSKLKSNPNLSACENLESLILKGCANLKEIDPSIQYAKRLLLLNLSGCRSLKMLPEQLGELEHLVELVLDNTQIKEIPPCIGSLKKLKRLSAQRLPQLAIKEHSPLEKIPSSIGKLGELVELVLTAASIKGLPESIGELNKLKFLRLTDSMIERLPSSIGKLQSLQELNASGCHNLEGKILLDKGGLSSLKTLYLSLTNISGLPENLDQLSSLERLHLGNYEDLQSLPKPPCSLLYLTLTCRSKELPSLSHLKHLQQLYLYYCESLQSIPSLSHLERLQRLWLFDCESLQEIPELPSCIKMLVVCDSPKVERLPNLSDLEFLLHLHLENCDGLKKFDGLESLKSLIWLRLMLSPLLYAERVDHLHAIEGLEKLGSLEVVDISGREHIQVLDLSKSEHLKELIVTDCKSLVEICCPSKFLKWFERDGCKSLKKLPDLFIEESNNEKLTEDYQNYPYLMEDVEEYSDSMEDD